MHEAYCVFTYQRPVHSIIEFQTITPFISSLHTTYKLKKKKVSLCGATWNLKFCYMSYARVLKHVRNSTK